MQNGLAIKIESGRGGLDLFNDLDTPPPPPPGFLRINRNTIETLNLY